MLRRLPRTLNADRPCRRALATSRDGIRIPSYVGPCCAAGRSSAARVVFVFASTEPAPTSSFEGDCGREADIVNVSLLVLFLFLEGLCEI